MAIALAPAPILRNSFEYFLNWDEAVKKARRDNVEKKYFIEIGLYYY
jgi:hypothetical protein